MKPVIPAPSCNTIADIAFLLDASGSIGASNFIAEKSLMKNLSRAFGISRDKAHIGVVRFDDTADVSIKLNQTYDQVSKQVLDVAIQRSM